ncbi:ribonucleoprotein PTB-binding 2 [Bombina bombina]|uniref:ribonucleoprotein PTB-binding 2 n=1 Tax=Bombina bombina TaxID=8345 RepID=UPI00235B14C0|nr:ribonucleoprotein PTB-binding 2 [Bombina bombina]
MAAAYTGGLISTEQWALKTEALLAASGAPVPGSEKRPGAEEAARRLEATRRELGNRRKILMRNLPHDCSSQDIHDLLKDYEIKYCYVDKNKKTAFISLLNGKQAQDAIQNFHQYTFRDKEISVQLQPTDAVLCITNLPPLLSLQEFEELVRVYGNIERCFLVYSEFTGNSKGYGFVEYMKKDSASKARLELLGKTLEEYTLFAQWMDINQLTEDLIHSKCLSVDKLPKDCNSSEIMQLFSSLHQPAFFQLAEDEGSHCSGFAVVEYETAQQAEEVRSVMDCAAIKGSKIQVSFCAPGSPGRSTLAALVAAQGMLQNNRKGLLPEPNPVQIMQSLNNPAMLQMLLQSQNLGRAGNHGSPPGHPRFLNPTVSQAILQLNKLHQKPGLGGFGNAQLQNVSHLQMAHQQLLQLKSSQSNNCKPGLLGEAPASMLQTAIGSAQQGSMEASQRDVQKNLMPYFHTQHANIAMPRISQEKQATPGAPDGSVSQANIQQSLSIAAMSQNQSKPGDTSQGKSNQTSLLGEPPKDFRLSTNPYLNLASVFPGSSMAGLGTRNLQQYAAMVGSSQDTSSQPAIDSYFNYSQPYEDYSQESLQQWYDQYSSYNNTQTDTAVSQTEESQKTSTSDQYQAGAEGESYYYQAAGYGDYNTYVQAPPTYYANAQGSYQVGSSESSDKTSEKRAYFVSPVEPSHAGYTEQYSQSSADNYSDSYFKRKKVY